jgi:acetyl esterase/lipase
MMQTRDSGGTYQIFSNKGKAISSGFFKPGCVTSGMAIRTLISVVISLFGFFAFGQQEHAVIPLYEGQIPNSLPGKDQEKSEINADGIRVISKVSRPTLTVFLPPPGKANGTAVVICPGGGYVNLAFDYEGTDVARRFNESGITAFVLKYRIPDDSTMVDKTIGPLQDAQRAIQMLRSRAREWHLDPHRIGLMGFSAGGHLASTAGTHFEKNYISNPQNISLRPDFLLLIYPVISFEEPNVHWGSANNLLGTHPSAEMRAEYSNELKVTDMTPPSFLVHAKDDATVPYQNSVLFDEALRKHHVPEEIYLYDRGGHGFSMKNGTNSFLWMDLCIQWIDRLH